MKKGDSTMWPILLIIVVCLGLIWIVVTKDKASDSVFKDLAAVVETMIKKNFERDKAVADLQSEVIKLKQTSNAGIENYLGLNSKTSVHDHQMADLERKFRELEYQALKPRAINVTITKPVRVKVIKSRPRQTFVSPPADRSKALEALTKKVKDLSK